MRGFLSGVLITVLCLIAMKTLVGAIAKKPGLAKKSVSQSQFQFDSVDKNLRANHRDNLRREAFVEESTP